MFKCNLLNEYYKNGCNLSKANQTKINQFVNGRYTRNGQNGYNILHYICRAQIPDLNLFMYFVDAGIDINPPADHYQCNVLEHAVMYSHKKIRFNLITYIVEHPKFISDPDILSRAMKWLNFEEPDSINIYEYFISKGGKIDYNHLIKNVVHLDDSNYRKYVSLMLNDPTFDAKRRITLHALY